VASTVYFQHAGSELQRGVNLIRLVALLRRRRPQSIWILDRTIRQALAAALAGIPERIGLGLGPQSAFITNDGVGQDHFHDHPIDWLRALMAAMKVPLVSTEPDLQLPTPVLSLIGERFAQFARPWIAVGIGASHPDKDWPTPPGANFCVDCGRPALSFWSEGRPMTRARKNLFQPPVHVRSSMPAICD
jgi:heptosyltransferase-2